MPKLAIVAALEREVRPLVKTWRVGEKEYDGRQFRFFENGDAVLVCGGIGAASARSASEAIITLYDPQVICSAGFAGALDSRVKVGDVVRPATVINAGDGSRTVVSDGAGVLVSFGSVAEPEQKRKLKESFGAETVDMEAAAVARSAEAHGKHFIAVKAISDELDFEFPAMDRFVASDGRFLEARFAVYAALRPWLWPQVIRLARNSNRAAHALCMYLRTISV